MPKPGILDIAPYVPGKAGAKGQKVHKLSANENNCVFSRKRRVPARSVFKLIVTIPPNPRICCRAKSCCGCDFSPG